MQRAKEEMRDQILDKEAVWEDYYTCFLSRELSRLVRKVVLNGRAKFGAGGAGKEVPQVAMARAFKRGDYLSGYYRDQTFMLSKGLMNSQDFFAFLYGDCDHESHSGGRQMPNGFATAFIDDDGNDLDQTDRYNVSSVISSVAAQVPRALGLALASKMYRRGVKGDTSHLFSKEGQEICFCTIGDASTSEGAFFESVNAAGVMQIPLAIFIWDDGYGISVPTKYQTTKESISEVLKGFQINEDGNGVDIYSVKAWDYENLTSIIDRGIAKVRSTSIPAIFHIEECTQPFGHSTSGSHERYKTQTRLQWEKEFDGILVMRRWMLANHLATEEQIRTIENRALREAASGNQKAWKKFRKPIEILVENLHEIYNKLPSTKASGKIKDDLKKLVHPTSSHLLDNARQMQLLLSESAGDLDQWIVHVEMLLRNRYNTHLYSESSRSALNVTEVKAIITPSAKKVNGHEILNAYFDQMLATHPNTYAFGEDVGLIGDVNQGFAGLQKKYGEERVFDTGIREWTIVGQAIGMAQRGLRPIAEIQYVDYMAYAFSPLTDDLATMRFRTNGQQKAPVIIRTRGHRLEGIWHSGSPMGMLIHSMRGIYLCVPRNMTQAAGMYNTMLQSDDPAIIIECLNGYRVKEPLPENLAKFTVPLGKPEILHEGSDITLVTYGSCVRIAEVAMAFLIQKNIAVELIDVQTLLPFDRNHLIVASLKKTNRILFVDEDVPGGATAYMMQEVLERQGGYHHLDAPPRTLTAKAHRPAFGDDGNYSSKPNAQDIVAVVVDLMKA